MALRRFMQVTFTEIFTRMEFLRRYGMTCECCKDKRREKIAYTCKYSGRRLKHAPDHLKKREQRFLQRANQLTEEECLNDKQLWESTVAMLRSCATMIMLKFRFLFILPARFCVADSVEGAQECLELLRQFPIEKHEPLTRDIMDQFGADIALRADGGPASEGLKLMCARFNNGSLDESCGEGWHRSSHHAKQHALNISDHGIGQTLRVQQNTSLALGILDAYGQHGRNLIRYSVP